LNRKEIEATVEKLTINIIAELFSESAEKIEVVDVEYVKERDFYLRVFLDKESGIELDDCQLISERLEEKLDALDLIQSQYYLEVSSPGLDRALKKEKDFLRHAGELVEVKLYSPLDGVKAFIGTLGEFKDGVIEINNAQNAEALTKKGKKQKGAALPVKDLKIPLNDAAGVKLYLDF
jgi:ribosome maturation factor RimP